MSSPSTSSSTSLRINRHWILLGLILVLAAGVRLYSLNGLGFWIDEFCTLSEINGWGLHVSQLPPLGILRSQPPRYTQPSDARPVVDVIRGLAHEDAHPPLYFLALRGWSDLFGGESESIVRSLNVVLSLIAIVLLYAAVRQQAQFPPSAALWACLLMALAGPQIEFAQEARNYIPLETLSLAAALVLLRIERLGSSATRWVALALTTAAMLFTHYSAVAVIAAMGVYALWNLRRKTRWATAAALAAGAAIFVVLWGPMLLQQRAVLAGGHAWLIESGPNRVSDFVVQLLRVPGRLLVEPGAMSALAAIAVIGAIGWLLVVIGIAQPAERLWAIWTIVVVGAVAATDVVNHTAQLKFIRFTLAAGPPLYLLIAAATWRRRIAVAGMQWIIPLGAVLLEILALPRAYVPPWKIDFRTPALAIAGRLQPQDGLIFIGPPHDDVGLALTYNGIRHYLPVNQPTTVALLQNPATPNQLAQLSACPQVWVIWLAPQSRILNSVLPGFTSLEPPGHVPYFIDLYRGQIDHADHYSTGH